MIYKITLFSEEKDNFKLVFECDSDATFLDLHNAILAAVNYPNDQMTSFYVCNDRGEREQEVTLLEMESSFEYDNMVMENTLLSELLTEPKQRLQYVFDPMFDRYFYGLLSNIAAGHKDGIECVTKEGKAPKQLETDNILDINQEAMDLDEDFYGSDEYDPDELDAEGFGDMNFDDSSLF